MRTSLLRDAKRSHASRWLIIAGVVLIATAVVAVSWRSIQSWRAGLASEKILSALNEERTSSYIDANVPDAYDLLRPSSRAEQRMPVIEVDGQEYIGSIALPTIDIEVPVCATLSNELLLESPCCYEGSYRTDDLIICGEGFATHFGNIGTVGIKDEVRLHTVDGVLHRYVVSNVENDWLQDIDAIFDDWDLSLFTFNSDGTVCVVRCVRV